MHRYLYAANDAANFVDPNGEEYTLIGGITNMGSTGQIRGNQTPAYTNAYGRISQGFKIAQRATRPNTFISIRPPVNLAPPLTPWDLVTTFIPPSVWAAAVASTAGTLGLLGASLMDGEDDGNKKVVLYHGTGKEDFMYLLNRNPLDAAVASERNNDSGGAIGFYLATHYSTAEFFAYRRKGAVLRYTFYQEDLDQLAAQGCRFQPIPVVRRFSPNFEGLEYFVPTSAFPLFNQFLAAGRIEIAYQPTDPSAGT